MVCTATAVQPELNLLRLRTNVLLGSGEFVQIIMSADYVCSPQTQEPLTFLMESSEADTISHSSAADSFSMATKESTGGTCRPSASAAASTPERRRDPLLPPPPPLPPPAAGLEELVTDDAIFSHASRRGVSLLLHLLRGQSRETCSFDAGGNQSKHPP